MPKKYRLLVGTHGRREDGQTVVYKSGDAIELSEAEEASFGDRVAPWSDDAPSEFDDAVATVEATERVPRPRRQAQHPKRRGAR